MILMPMTGFTNGNNSLNDSDELNTGARSEGCTNANAVNFDPEATTDDGSCKYEPELWTPNGGEEWEIGSTQEITWQASGWSVVSLYYSNDVGESWIHIATVDNGGVYDWEVPDAPNDMAIVKVQVTGIDGSGNNATWSDEGNSTFIIPSAGPTGIGPCEKFAVVANGFVGYMWVDPNTAVGQPYGPNDIVEWPAGSGQFWRSDVYNNYGEPGISANWWGPCTCEDAWNATQTVWDSTTVYQTWEVVEHNGNLYYSNCFNCTNQGYEPGISSAWILCHNGSTTGGCDVVSHTTGSGYNGYGGPVWTSGTSISIDEIYEYPANSGEYWIAEQDATNPVAPDAPNGHEFWNGSCNCSEIWIENGAPLWSNSQWYNQWYFVEWPAGSGNLWLATPGGYGDEPVNHADSNWTACSDDEPGPCGEFNGYGGPVWNSNTAVNTGEIYEHPAGSGEFYIVEHPGLSSQTVMPPDAIGAEEIWSEYCNCTEIWTDNNQPIWDSAQAYNAWYIVEWTASSGNLWIASGGNTMVGDEPSKDPKWTLCGATPTQGGPCEQFNGFAGPAWPPVSGIGFTGEIYEFPAGSGEFYMVVNGPITDDPLSNLDAWSDRCNCTEIWEGNGQPLWNSALATPTPSNPYDLWFIVGEIVSGSPVVLYVSEAMNNPLQPSGLLRWHPCMPTDCTTANGEWPHWINPQWTGVGYSIDDQVSHGNGLYISLVDNNHAQPGPGSVEEGLWKLCECSDLPHTTWNNLANYVAGDIVEDANGDYWIALLPHSGVQPTPFVTHDASGNEALFWRPCDYCKLSDSHIDGVWNQATGSLNLGTWMSNTNPGGYGYGDIVEHTGTYYISIVNNPPGLFQNNYQEPGTQTWWVIWGSNNWPITPLRQEGWVECDCEQIANGNIWQSGNTYTDGDVVIGPNNEVWISTHWWNPFPIPGLTMIWTWNGQTHTWVIPTWKRCNPTGGCGDDVALWDPVAGAAGAYVAGDTVAWPNAGNEWRLLVTGSTDTPGFNTDWRHCKMLPSDWPDHSKTLPPDAWAELDHTQDMAICDSRAVEASGLAALDAEDGTYLCAAELTYSIGDADSTETASNDSTDGRTSGRIRYCHPINSPDRCCGDSYDNDQAALNSYNDNCGGSGAMVGNVDPGWVYDEQDDGSLIAKGSLPGVTCASPILEDVIAGYTCTDNIAIALHKEWTQLPEDTLVNAISNGYRLVDDCRVDGVHTDLLCGTMTSTGATYDLGDDGSALIVGLNPGGVGYHGHSVDDYYCGWCGAENEHTTESCPDRPDDDGDASQQSEPYYCGWCGAENSHTTESCPDKPDDSAILVVASVYDNIDIGGHLMIESTDILVDEDNDGVVDDWDTCPNTANGTATDAEGCEVEVKSDDDSGGGLPGFTLMLTISALLGAIVYTNRIRRID